MSGNDIIHPTPVAAGRAATRRKKRLGVIGTFVWDVIHPWPPGTAPTEGWGGIAYPLAALDAALDPEWEVVPIIKVGSDVAAAARRFLEELHHLAPDAALTEVEAVNNRSEIRYVTPERRVERLGGCTPGWSWAELGPRVQRASLDALYLNFLSGWELDLPTARALRAVVRGPIHADLHMLVWAPVGPGVRELRPLPDASGWYAAVDFLQVNEDEMGILAPDADSLAAHAAAAGVSCTIITLGSGGSVAYPVNGFHSLADLERVRGCTAPQTARAPVRVPASRVPEAEIHDPTGCGDVWGATFLARMLAGETVPAALRRAAEAAARNVAHRGAAGLAAHLGAGDTAGGDTAGGNVTGPP